MRRVGMMLSVATALWLSAVTPAWGLWSPPVQGLWSVALPYGARYEGKTHHGIDVSADAGSSVRAPVAGTVVFAGQIPSDGGGTCGAITIQTDDGLRISLLPIADMTVAEGAVEAGAPLGAVAAQGDDSSAQAHVHVGLRSGETYLDPTALLGPAPAAREPEPEAAPQVPASAPADPGPAPAAPVSPPVADAAAHPSASAASALAVTPAVTAASPSETAVSAEADPVGTRSALPSRDAQDVGRSMSRTSPQGRARSVRMPSFAAASTCALVALGLSIALALAAIPAPSRVLVHAR